MNRALFPVLAALVAVIPAWAQADKAGCKDHPLFPTRMPGYVIDNCKTEEFGVFDFSMVPREKQEVEGKYTFITYGLERGREQPSPLAVVRNYENAIRSVGGTIVKSDPTRRVNGKILKDGKEVWVQAEKGNGKIWLRIVEKQAMKQYVEADAAAMGQGLKATGHMALYGIHFDTNKSEIKPESKAALEEVAKLLKAQPGLKLMVVGHTDAVGSFEANLKLSQARGQAVVQALVTQYGIAPGRLRGQGVGPMCPVASNDAEAGRAQNRRVELVKE